jgi:hypothetical protein
MVSSIPLRIVIAEDIDARLRKLPHPDTHDIYLTCRFTECSLAMS